MKSAVTNYVVLTSSESSGEHMIYLGEAEAEAPKQAILSVLEETTDRPVQIKKDTYCNAPKIGYVAVPRDHWNRFREG